MRDRGLTLDHALGDAVHLVTIWGLGQFGIEASLEGYTLPAIQSTAHRASVNRSVLTCVPAGRIGVEGHTRDICQSPTVLRHGACRVGRSRHLVYIAPPGTQATTEARPPEASWP
jgi:hypothetical protein